MIGHVLTVASTAATATAEGRRGMLVYGDVSRTEPALAKVERIAAALAALPALPAGLQRHAELVTAFIEAGDLLQGIADHEAERAGADTLSPRQAGATALLLDLARAIWTSWTSGFAHAGPLPPLSALEAGLGPETLRTKLAEGFAFYAVYPECYAAAAAVSGLDRTARVIGIRSIGAPLSAMVAAALGAAAPVTVRPAGHPFRRELAVSAALADVLLGGGPARIAVVDEGPGLSGSSFGAVADWLESRGVARDRLVFFPSHGGAPGPEASPRHRARWQGAARPLVEVDSLMLAAPRPEHRLSTWIGDLLGEGEVALEDLSAGRWRSHRHRTEADWPPVCAQQERRKLLARARGDLWIARFAGLGAEGHRKLDRARRLHAAGFTPTVAGLCHGFLVERWIAHGRTLEPAAMDPDALALQVGRYLGFRARAFPAEPEGGASLHALLAMARHNATEALGPACAGGFDRWTPQDVDRLARRQGRIETDNRLHAWEWLALPGGRLLKCDALDHHAAHDLIGCQDVAWDIAGARVELGLTGAAGARLEAVTEREGGRPIDPALIALLTPCYLAFQLGLWSMAAAACDAAEARRMRRQVDRYGTMLGRVLAGSEAG